MAHLGSRPCDRRESGSVRADDPTGSGSVRVRRSSRTVGGFQRNPADGRCSRQRSGYGRDGCRRRRRSGNRRRRSRPNGVRSGLLVSYGNRPEYLAWRFRRDPWTSRFEIAVPGSGDGPTFAAKPDFSAKPKVSRVTMVVMTETTPEQPSETTAAAEPPARRDGRWDKSHRRGGRPFRLAALVVTIAGVVFIIAVIFWSGFVL
ncbi:MAG: hypothetical protein JWR34_2729, partial [Mycobacterium sp.]|nr:hypothetical protein [Mycobacterium sp.]